MKSTATLLAILAFSLAGCWTTVPEPEPPSGDDDSAVADDDDNDVSDDDATQDDDVSDDDATQDDDDATPPPADDDDVTPDPDPDGDGRIGDADCDQSDPDVYVGAQELDDNVDNDCDGLVDEGFDPDADGDGYSSEPDCDDSDPEVSPGADEDCDDGIDNDCDEDIDEDDEDCEVLFDGHEFHIIVSYGSATPAVDFSYGYCSDQANPANCLAWNQSVATSENMTSVTYTIPWVTTGSIRANSSRFYQASDWNGTNWVNADAWLCQNGGSAPTGTVSIWIDGIQVATPLADVYCFPFQNGDSLGIEVAPLLAQIN